MQRSVSWRHCHAVWSIPLDSGLRRPSTLPGSHSETKIGSVELPGGDFASWVLCPVLTLGDLTVALLPEPEIGDRATEGVAGFRLDTIPSPPKENTGTGPK